MLYTNTFVITTNNYYKVVLHFEKLGINIIGDPKKHGFALDVTKMEFLDSIIPLLD